MATISTSVYGSEVTIKATEGYFHIKTSSPGQMTDASLMVGKEDALKLAHDILAMLDDGGDIEGRKLMDAQDVAAEVRA